MPLRSAHEMSEKLSRIVKGTRVLAERHEAVTDARQQQEPLEPVRPVELVSPQRLPLVKGEG